jgi:hypothetical protein
LHGSLRILASPSDQDEVQELRLRYPAILPKKNITDQRTKIGSEALGVPKGFRKSQQILRLSTRYLVSAAKFLELVGVLS